MGEVAINRAAWARLCREFISVESHERVYGAKTRFAAKAGVSVRTVDNWLDEKVDAREQNVRTVAKAYDRNELELLIKVGFYSVDILLGASLAVGPDEELDMILAAPVSDVDKQRLVQRMLTRQERDKQRRMEDLRFDIEQIQRGRID